MSEDTTFLLGQMSPAIIREAVVPSVQTSLNELLYMVRLLLELYRLQGNITRVKINELKPLKPRYEVPDVLIREPPTEPLSLLSQDENGVVLSLGAESQRVIVSARPFRLDIVEGREVLMSLNSRGLLGFEHLRMRKDTFSYKVTSTVASVWDNIKRVFSR
ncbi:hypothetical protein ILYODFUR_036264 [Ilyodon furcidens]|uniref:Glycoside hydrolase family 31 N-terminal domain-containing protein n=1 Tax=Ilyodon furcidens TaxID=33524 RepID=A0ABV0UZ21_9TELE